MKPLEITISDVVEIINCRIAQGNDFRGCVSGETFLGKSTLIAKILFRIKGFDPWKHQVYKRSDVLNILLNETNSIAWDDESIESNFSQNWQDPQQQEIIKTLTKYRSSRNIYFATIPNFFSQQSKIRDLFFIHLHVVAKGVAVVHMKNTWSLYSPDRWDTSENAKIEKKWVERRKRDPTFRIPFHQLSTFRAYLYYGDITPNQRKIIEEVKEIKRRESDADKQQDKSPELKFNDKMYALLMNGELTSQNLEFACKLDGKKISSVKVALNNMLKDNFMEGTLKDYFKQSNKKQDDKRKEELLNNV